MSLAFISMKILVRREAFLYEKKMDIFPSFYFLKKECFFYAHKSLRSDKRFIRVDDAPVSMVSSR